MLPFTPYELAEAVERGEVTARRHPTLPYTIFNYSPEVQYTNRWNDITLNCRGLILDDEFNIIARPWKKFFNLGQVNLPIQLTDPVEVMDKADGSLGILYPEVVDTPEISDVFFRIATRGSFESDQAKHATKVWNERYSHLSPIPGYTMLFEIVYPENRIVLNYDGMDDLILLGAVENETGYYYGPKTAKYMFLNGNFAASWTGPVVEVFNFNTISDALGHMERANAEGYVIRSHNFMVKLKQPDYLELHRLVTNASPKAVWEQLKSGKSKSEIVSAFPDEFHDYVGGMIDPLLESFDRRLQEILEEHSERVAKVMDKHTWPDRKDFAAEFKKSPEKRYHFLMFDSKPIRDVLWTELRPRETVPESIQS